MPELFLSNYFCQTENHSNFKLAEKIPGKTTKIFCELAKELQIVLMISLFEKKGNKKIEFWGNSMIIDPSGEIIGELGNKKEEILIREIDYKKIDTTREHWPFLRDRRIDFYKGILKNPVDE